MAWPSCLRAGEPDWSETVIMMELMRPFTRGIRRDKLPLVGQATG